MARKIANMDRHRDGYRNRFTVNGKRYTVYGKTQEECREREAQKRAEIAAGLYQKGAGLTVQAYFDRWIADKEKTVKSTTIRSNKNLFAPISRAVIDKAGTTFGSLKLKEVEAQNVKDLQKALLKDHSTRTVNDSVTLIKSLYKAAINERIVDWNPAAGIRALKRTEERVGETIHRALTKEETAAFFASAEERHSWYLNLYIFLLNTGCRIGEAGALYRSDIGAEGIHIQRTITRTEGGYKIGEATKTAAGQRYVPLSDEARAAVEAQKDLELKMTGGKVLPFKQPIFRSPNGLLLNSSPINEDLAKICDRAGIERFTCHAFRDTFATRCVESGMPPKTLMDIMGHTDINMTMRYYVHTTETTKNEQLRAVNFM